MSRSLDLDFLAPAGRPAAWSWLLLVLGVALAAWSAQGWLQATEAQAQARARLDDLERTHQPKAKQPARPDAQAQARRQGEVAARRQLALPWDDLLRTLQRTRPKEVALLSLDGDGRRGDFQLDAEARGHGVMLDYLRQLQREPALRDVTLTQHQGADSDGARVVRFTLRGTWGQP